MSRASSIRACNSANFRLDRKRHDALDMVNDVIRMFAPSLPKVDTHYLPAFTKAHPSDPAFRQAVCGQFISILNDQHSASPSCPRCEAWLAANVDVVPAEEV